ncbi:MAG: glycosyltransferase [Phycisphaerae bacterium]|jgi:glycosyltransferase involved in cell wall biosynthesis|nr:glycosyltransferase [Phycisphaerae bacterium]MDP7635958.1 glycosyltransferase [Phycisphaerae bacterium]
MVQGQEGTDRQGGNAPTEGAEGLNLLVVLPALNEERTVGDVIRRIPRGVEGISSTQVLVVDDGSSDQTGARAAEAGAEVIRHDSPLGVGEAFREALTYAIDRPIDLIVCIDADGQFDPADIPALTKPVVEGKADFATASRFKDPSLTPKMPWVKRWGNGMMSRLISHLSQQKFHDVSCGMRCYSREAAMHLNLLGGFTYTQEVFLNLAFKKMRIVEVPVKVRGRREFGKSRVANSIPKYAFNTLRIILRCYRDYRPMKFFGWIAAVLMVPGGLLVGFLLTWYIIHGAFTPHKWAGFTGVSLFAMGLLVLWFGMIGDMLDRHRIYLEELLYEQRRVKHPRHRREEDANKSGNEN